MIRIWTDGACNSEHVGRSGPAGWAFVAVRTGFVIERQSGGVLHGDAGRMELLAVIEAVRWADGEVVEVYTDSHYVAHGFSAMHGWRHSGWRYGKRKGRRPVRDRDLWESLWSMARNAPVTVHQIHRAVNEHNVEADQAAKEAMRRAAGPQSEGEHLLLRAIENALRRPAQLATEGEA